MLQKWKAGMWETVLSDVWNGQVARALVWGNLRQESIEKTCRPRKPRARNGFRFGKKELQGSAGVWEEEESRLKMGPGTTDAITYWPIYGH